MQFKDRINMQLDEAFGPVNRWYCSEHHGYEVKDRETLLRYYIQRGGAKNFADTSNSIRQNRNSADDSQH
jgi:hypothetical protein